MFRDPSINDWVMVHVIVAGSLFSLIALVRHFLFHKALTNLPAGDLFAAKALFDKHSACFVDARSEYAYYNSHIKGAQSSLSPAAF